MAYVVNEELLALAKSAETPKYIPEEERVTKTEAPGCLRLDASAVRSGIIMSEVLGRPVSKRRGTGRWR